MDQLRDQLRTGTLGINLGQALLGSTWDRHFWIDELIAINLGQALLDLELCQAPSDQLGTGTFGSTS